jgi:hypothetical protein
VAEHRGASAEHFDKPQPRQLASFCEFWRFFKTAAFAANRYALQSKTNKPCHASIKYQLSSVRRLYIHHHLLILYLFNSYHPLCKISNDFSLRETRGRTTPPVAIHLQSRLRRP